MKIKFKIKKGNFINKQEEIIEGILVGTYGESLCNYIVFANGKLYDIEDPKIIAIDGVELK